MGNDEKNESPYREKQRFFPMRDISKFFGFTSPNAMWKAFKRGILPKRFLIKGPTKALLVDKPGLEGWYVLQTLAHFRKKRRRK